MSPHHVGAAETAARFPRVSGDEPVGGSFDNEAQQFSPREWG